MRYIHVEILGFMGNETGPCQKISVGDKVHVKPSVVTPTYKWGSVSHNCIGTVTGMERVPDTYIPTLYMKINMYMYIKHFLLM